MYFSRVVFILFNSGPGFHRKLLNLILVAFQIPCQLLITLEGNTRTYRLNGLSVELFWGESKLVSIPRLGSSWAARVSELCVHHSKIYIGSSDNIPPKWSRSTSDFRQLLHILKGMPLKESTGTVVASILCGNRTTSIAVQIVFEIDPTAVRSSFVPEYNLEFDYVYLGNKVFLFILALPLVMEE